MRGRAGAKRIPTPRPLLRPVPMTLLRTTVPLLALGLALAVAVVPTAHADEASLVSCGAATDFINYVVYHCTVLGSGATGVLILCPPGFCISSLYCAAEVSPLAVGCNFP